MNDKDKNEGCLVIAIIIIVISIMGSCDNSAKILDKLETVNSELQKANLKLDRAHRESQEENSKLTEILEELKKQKKD